MYICVYVFIILFMYSKTDFSTFHPADGECFQVHDVYDGTGGSHVQTVWTQCRVYRVQFSNETVFQLSRSNPRESSYCGNSSSRSLILSIS